MASFTAQTWIQHHRHYRHKHVLIYIYNNTKAVCDLRKVYVPNIFKSRDRLKLISLQRSSH